MFTFTHFSYATITDAQYGKLSAAQKANCEVADAAKKTWKLWMTEKLTVPISMAELAAVKSNGVVDVTLGSDSEAKDFTLDLPVYDYIVGRKLRSNQEMQSSLKDDGAVAKRAKAVSWYCTHDAKTKEKNTADFMARMMGGAASKAATADFVAWQDKLYIDNEAAIEKVK